jgi:hypothetical protein
VAADESKLVSDTSREYDGRYADTSRQVSADNVAIGTYGTIETWWEWEVQGAQSCEDQHNQYEYEQ